MLFRSKIANLICRLSLRRCYKLSGYFYGLLPGDAAEERVVDGNGHYLGFWLIEFRVNIALI